jgi:hypothetical protein
MNQLDQGLATLLAAIIAALLSLLTYLSTKPTEIRAANRKTLELYICDIADSIHQLIATSNIFLKNKSIESRQNWKAKSELAKTKLKNVRPKVRYPLWGLEKHLLSLTRLPDYTSYCLENPEVARELVKWGSRFGDRVDKCIKNCYLNGRPPFQIELLVIGYYDWRFRKIRNDYKKARIALLKKNN